MKQFKRDEKQRSSKLHLDKYYTSDEIAQYCIDVARKILKGEKITEVIEPSAGNGAFSKKIKGCIAYDIEPEDETVLQQDFLELDLPYKRGRLFIGNPPFGARNTLAVQFFKRAIQLGDYIAFILPISQLNNNQQMYEFDLIHSEDLGKQRYTDRDIHCCFNIYKRPPIGLNSKPINKLQDVKITEIRLANKECQNYDMRICAWGAIGKEVEFPNQFAKEFCIEVLDQTKKKEVLDALRAADWCKLYAMTSMPNLLQWQVIDYLKKKIPNIK